MIDFTSALTIILSLKLEKFRVHTNIAAFNPLAALLGAQRDLQKCLFMISIWTSLNYKIIDDRKYATVFVSNVFFSVGHIII